MKKRRIQYILPVFIVAATIGFVFAYDNITTHPQLSRAAVNVFQNYSGKALTQQQVSWIVQGSVDEDAAPRYLNHYYNPVTNSGLNDWDEFLRMDVDGISAKEWAQNQGGYISHAGDYSEPAILENYRIGNKERAYQGVGHILHLMQDMSVPAHTRNDSHAGGDPYENWAKQNGSVESSKASFISVENLDDAFNGLAAYSSNNFFSQDTIVVNKPLEKIINKEGNIYFYCRDNLNNKFICLREIEKLGKIYFVISDPVVHLDYWNLLSLKAVGYSAGVIDYFVKQFEKIDAERQKVSLAANIINGFMATFSSIQYTWGDVFMAANVPLSDTVIFGIKVFNSFADGVYYPLSAQLAGLIPTNIQPQPQTATVVQPAPAPALNPVIDTPVAVNVPQQVQEPVVITSQIIQEVVEPLPEEKTGGEDAQAPVDNVVVTPVPDIIPPPVPVYRGSGSVTGISPDALAAQNNPAPQSQTESADTGAFSTSTEEVLLEETATSTDEVIDDTATTTDPIIADATSTEPILPVPPTPITDFKDSIVINEVAWMGTKAQANDEWIELHNKTDQDIDLSGWKIESKNKALSVALSGVISANGYFLLERTASTTTDVAEDMIFSGSINNAGPDANLYLKNGATVIDSVDFGYWPAGDNGKRYTMERVSTYATSTLSYNWKTYGDPDAVSFAKDAKGDDIFGTPGKKNSVSGFYTPTGNITENTTWHKEQSPYFVPTQIIITDDATLTIEPGVVVKFTKAVSFGGMDVRGTVVAEGTSGDPIIFTSFLDDAVDGIDSNRDASVSAPAAGDWLNIIFTNKSQMSVIKNARVRYGGGWYPTYTGVLSAQGGGLEISDSIIENNSAIAVYAKNGSRPKIYRNTIQETAQNTSAGVAPLGVGIFIGADASAEITDNTIKNNSVGIISESATDEPLIVKNNIFDDNKKNGEFLKGYANWNLENSGNEDVDKKGGFEIRFIVYDGQEKTLHADAIPYVIGDTAKILAGGKLTIEPGAVFKFTTFSNGAIVQFVADGVLSAAGTEEEPIVFTAFADDSDGYDSNNSSLDPTAGAWKNIVFTGAASSDSVLEHVHVRYGGQGESACPYAYFGGPCMEYYGAVRIDGADPKMSHVTLENNLGISIFTEGVANPAIENSTIRDTKEAIKNSTAKIGGYGISIGPDSEPTVTDNTYANNAEDVVYRE